MTTPPRADSGGPTTPLGSPRRGTARASGDLAWVASDNDMVIHQDGKPVTIASAETMVLRRTGGGWKIVHIHWSSRTRKQ